METTKITPRFKVGQKVIAKKHWLHGTEQYVWMRIAKVEVLNIVKPQPYYNFFGEWRSYGEDNVFATEDELLEKTGKKINEEL